MQSGGAKRQVSPEEYQASLQQGYKQISPNTAVKNTQQNQLKAASATTLQAGQMTAQEKAKYDNWINQQMSSGTSPLKLYELGYISKEQADKLQLSYKPVSDTIYTKPINVEYKPMIPFDYDMGNAKGYRQGDTLWFQPSVPKQGRERARMIIALNEGRNENELFIKDLKTHYFQKFPSSSNKDLTYFQMGGQKSWPNTLGFGQLVEKRNLDQLPFFRTGGLKHFQPGGNYGQNEFIPSNNFQSAFQYQSPENILNTQPEYYDFSMTEKVQAPKFKFNRVPQLSYFGQNKKIEVRDGLGEVHVVNPDNVKDKKEWNPMAVGNAINFGTGILAEYAGIYDRNTQQGYMNKMLYNPLSGILPFDDGRSKNIKEGYNMMQFGGMNQPFKMKMNRQGQLKFKGDINSFNNMFNSQPNYFGLNNPIAQNTFKDVLGYMQNGGEIIKRADGSYSRKGL